MKRALSILLLSWLATACARGGEALTPAAGCLEANPVKTVPDAKENAAREKAAGVQALFGTANGIKLHYLRAGNGPPVILLHGYAETSRMWLPLMAQLAKTNTVIAPDLRGAGDSEKPA